jgi:hypothetical protein
LAADGGTIWGVMLWVWDWKAHSCGHITRQLRRMSDDGLSYAVREVFVRFNLITQFVQIISVSGSIPISANHGFFFI